MDETQKNKLQAAREKLVGQIHRISDFSFEDKQRLIKVIDAIIVAEGTKIYTAKTPDYVEFIDLQVDPENRDAGFRLCLNSKSYDPNGGSSTCRMTVFPELKYFLNYVRENKGKMDVQITNAYNSARKNKEEQRDAKEEYKKQANARSTVRGWIERAQIPDFEKRRLEDLIDTLLVSPNKSIYTVIEDYFEERLALGIQESGLVEFRLKRRQLDYAGSTALRLPDGDLSFKGLVKYVAEHKEQVDKQIQKYRSQTKEEIDKFYQSEQTQDGISLED